LSKDGKKKFLGHVCGFCGTQLYANPPISLRCGEENIEVRASPGAMKNLEIARDTGLWYWIKICPECGSFVGVQIIEPW
jgi:hypothetical protein